MEEVPGLYDRLLDRIEALPGVAEVGAIDRLPFSGSYSCDLFVLEGWPMPEPGRGECAEHRVVAGDYFEAMGIRLVEGQPLSGDEGPGADPVVLVSRAMADRFMPGEEPLGRGFKWGLHDERPFRRIVGVVENVKHTGLDEEPMSEVYMPQGQYPYSRTMTVVIRAAGDPATLVAPIRDVVSELDPSLPVYGIATMQERLAGSILPQRLLTILLGTFALLALGLACLGLYGVLAYVVSQRSRELGVRMALGAAPGDVRGMVLRQGMLLVGIGLGIGGLVAWTLSNTLRGLLFGIQPTDPLTFATVVGCLVTVSLAASYLPARRATRLDPADSLRDA